MSTVDQKIGYRYTNPGKPFGASDTFDVLKVRHDDPKLIKDVAFFFQKIMHDAFAVQYEGLFSPEEIAQTAYHENPDMVTGQIELLSQEPDEGQPAYLRAEVLVHRVSQARFPLMPLRIGLGKSKYAGREGEPRSADISDVYVYPRYQSRGVGTAIASTLLEGFPEDMTTVAYDFELNDRLKPLLKELGFKAIKTWDAPYFGQQIPQTYYRGPLVGELAEILQKRSPWLKDRQPLEQVLTTPAESPTI